MLVLEAGIDIDVATLKLIGSRGMLIALVGSVLPIAIGMGIAYALYGAENILQVIAAGCTFGPTSLGIALNILKSGGILNTPAGQLIISAAVIDDMIALIILSILQALPTNKPEELLADIQHRAIASVGTNGGISAADILVPIVSACCFLFIGGYVAIILFPKFMERFVLGSRCLKEKSEIHGKVELAVMFGLLLAMMPATKYAKASYLMGAFVSGLAFCTSHDLHVIFIRQFKRLLQWLMRIFFAASIGFQVPINDFGSGKVIWQGLVFTIALLGKIVVGFMAPNFTQSRQFTGLHLRDCLLTGFSMAAEGEFAFVIAVFAVDKGMIEPDTYASVVLAVLISTIIPPFLLRFTISYYNKKAEDAIALLAATEMENLHDLKKSPDDALLSMTEEERNAQLRGDIKASRAVFLCIQTQSESRWGLLHEIMACLGRELQLDIIDHRSWHPRGINTTLVNEIYVKDKIEVNEKGDAQVVLDERMVLISDALQKVIDRRSNMNKKDDEEQKDDASRGTKIKVQRWYPGVVEEVFENLDGKDVSLEQRILTEASMKLDRNHNKQMAATEQKSVNEILAGMAPVPELPTVGNQNGPGNGPTFEKLSEEKRVRRRHRRKMRSTPVVGGGLFGETSTATSSSKNKRQNNTAGMGKWQPDFDFGRTTGHAAEITVDGEIYEIRINSETLKGLRTGCSGDFLDEGKMSIQANNTTPVSQLRGYVRTVQPLSRITEEMSEADNESETSEKINAGMPPV